MTALQPYEGIWEAEIAGNRLTFQYTNDALVRLKASLGADWLTQVIQMGDDPALVSRVAAFGLAAHHAGLTADALYAANVPCAALATAAKRAITLALEGPEDPAAAGKRIARTGRLAILLRRLWRWRSAWGSLPPISGA